MKRFFQTLLLLLTTVILSGQVNRFGVPFIYNYPTQMTPGSEQNWCIEKDVFGNMYFGNQDRGVIKYDGTKWTGIQIKNNTRMYSLESDSRGIVYVGAAFEFGYIQPDLKGRPEYISLAERTDSIAEIKVIYSIEILNDVVYFLSPRFIYRYETLTDKLTKIDLYTFGVSDAFRLENINGRLIIADQTNGLFEFKDPVITKMPGGEVFGGKKACTVLLPYRDSKVLIASFYFGLYLYDLNTGEVQRNFYDRNVETRIKNEFFYAGARINDNLWAIGTTGQGVLIIDGEGRLVQHIRKEDTSLEDNTVLALYSDYPLEKELWISTTGFIGKVYINEAVTKFSEEQGIDIGVNEIALFNGNIYLTSDGGIMKSGIDEENNLVFAKMPGLNMQAFPIEHIKAPHGDFLLAGSLNGVWKIDGKGGYQQVERVTRNLPGGPGINLDVKSITQSTNNPDIVYLGLQSGGVFILKMEGSGWRFIGRIKGIQGLSKAIVEKRDGGFWFATDDPDALFNVKVSGSDTTVVQYTAEKGLTESDVNSIQMIDNNLYVTTDIGIFRYDYASDSFTKGDDLTGGYSEGRHSVSLFVDEDNDLWFSGLESNYYEMLFRRKGEQTGGVKGIMNIFPNVPLLGIISHEGRVWMTKSKIVTVVDKSRFYPDTTLVSSYFTLIAVGKDTLFKGSFPVSLDSIRRVPSMKLPSSAIPVYSYDKNEIVFEWTTPDYTEELRTEYSYMLDGYDEDWSKWGGISFGYSTEALYPKVEYRNLPYGHYTFRVRTRTMTGQTTDELQYEFMIAKPWYATILAFVFFALAAFLAIYGIIAAYTRRLKNENIRLEGIVAERTAVVVKQKEELESSIHYASRIQMALLPSEAILSENLKNYFVLFKPRDIVSGDFYWMTKKGERLYIVAADCTGHGVPGAFMSLLGMSFLDEIIDKEAAPRADFILNELRQHVTESLKQSGTEDEAKDGMDMALLVIDFNSRRIEFSGAYNPCFRVRKLTESEISKYKDDSGEMPDGSMTNGKYLLETIYASKMPIGISPKMNEDFIFYDWQLERGISYYLFSDGYIDQFGGQHGRKFMKKNFKRLILDIQDYPMTRQKELLDQNLKDWMGQSPQIDDILVMGIRTD
jgi:serine phosphatase RsbU (regulator of sigma subunit)/ligand-binding sensor domain-containing protein